MKRSTLNTIHTIAVIVTGLVFVISIGGCFAQFHWRLAWYSNPRPHLAVVSALLLVWCLGRQNQILATSESLWIRTFSLEACRRLSGLSYIAGLSLLLNLLMLVPLFIQPDLGSVANSSITIAHLNTNRGRVTLAALNALNADVLLLQEVTPELHQDLPKALASYQLIYSHPLANTHGSAVLVHKDSPVEIRDAKIIHLPENSDRPLMATTLHVADQQIALLSLHLIRPQRAKADRYQQLELEAVADWSRDMQRETGDDVVIIGDFNVTPWSNRFLKLLAEGNLHNSQRGYGLQNTWPSTLPQWLGLPIDHAVHSDGLVTTARSTQVVTGTDHTLLQVTLAPVLTSL